MTKILSQKTIFEAKLFTVYEDNVELSPGSLRTYHQVVRNSAVSVFPLTNDNEIYLVDQYRYIHEKRLTEAVAGMIDPGEEPLTTAKRELMEEAGIEALEWIKLPSMKAAGSIVNWTQYLYVAKGLTFNEAQPEESEDIRLFKIPLQEAVEKVLNGEINTGSSMSGILMINEMVRKNQL